MADRQTSTAADGAETGREASAAAAPSGHGALIRFLVVAGCVTFVTLRLIDRTGDAASAVAAAPAGLANTAVDGAARVAEALGQAFQTEVAVENNSFSFDTEEIAELATVQRRQGCYTKYTVKSFKGEATVIVEGVFIAKAGYDLREDYTIVYDPATNELNCQLPKPKVLSLEVVSQRIWYKDDGLLQEVSPEDVDTAFRQNLVQARREARQSGLLADVEASLFRRLTDLFTHDRIRVRPQPATIE
jgi:hypothetical protein